MVETFNMRNIFVLICIPLLSLQAKADVHLAQDTGLTNDSAKKMHLVCRHKRRPDKRSRIITDGNRIRVRDSAGKSGKGKLKILDGDRFAVEYPGAKADTFSIGAVVHIKRLPPFRRALNTSLMAAGPAGMAGSIYYLQSADEEKQLVYGLFRMFAGMVLFAASAEIEIIGIYLSARLHFRSRRYTFHISGAK